MAHEDDDDWFDALAGRSPDEDSPSAREGRELRATLQREHADASVRQPHDRARDRAREAQLIERARREGLIGQPARSPFRAASAWGLAAAVCLAIGIGFFMRPTTPPIIERGADDIVHIQASDPVALRNEIIDELRAVGIDAVGYERLGLQGIDADLPTPLPNEVHDVLKRHGIDAPEDGTLQVEIAAP